MEDIKLNIAKNIAALRGGNGLTQADLAEKLNYSDKAVSKWERGESLPDIVILKQIADLFGVSIDALIGEDTVQTAAVSVKENDRKEEKKPARGFSRNRFIISALSVLGVWFIALLVAVIIFFSAGRKFIPWICFVSAVPVSLIVALVFNSIWGSKRTIFFIVSGLVWSIIATVYFALIRFNVWHIFLLGIPAQIAVILSFCIKKKQ
ncbi:MAG: helix-turn-helix transcriptional regulator [Ruminococcaceae bacterium]|nr:helix-turn-helix transcriptional regulator [Oscillospiraceae bacterium]